ncbi:MAG TPA: hypothetical protein DCY20_08020 [Firmicutes bacterium]|nr:hypothetical protein [Bacillota bacterium]
MIMDLTIKKYLACMFMIYLCSLLLKHLLPLNFDQQTMLFCLSNTAILLTSLKSIYYYLTQHHSDDILGSKKWFLFGCFYVILLLDQFFVFLNILHVPFYFLHLGSNIMMYIMYFGICYAIHFLIHRLKQYTSFHIILKDVILMAIPFCIFCLDKTRPLLSIELLTHPFYTQQSSHTLVTSLFQLTNLFFYIFILCLFMGASYLLPTKRSNRFILINYFLLNSFWFILSQHSTLTYIQLFPINHQLITFLIIFLLTIAMGLNHADQSLIINDLDNPYTYLNRFCTTLIIGMSPIMFLILSYVSISLYGGSIEGIRFGLLTVTCLLLIIYRDTYIRRENQKLLTKINNHATLDPLTQLYNRRGFFEKISQFNNNFTLFVYDVKKFKQINDSHGHDIGDLILKDIAKKLIKIKKTLSEPVVYARFGGDEFLLAIATQDLSIINKVCKLTSSTLYVLNSITSIKYDYALNSGYTFATPNDLIDDIIKQADIALYESKRLDSTVPIAFNDKLRHAYTQEIMVKNDLPKAIAANAISVVFQPKYDLHQDKIIGFETLARWTHPLAGFISPLTFVAYAEELGLSFQLDTLIFEKACEFQHELYLSSLNQTCAINISLTTLHHPKFIPKVINIMLQYEVDPTSFTFEILENVSLDKDKTRLIKILNTLQDIGFKISIDDFGTAYSSLNRLYEIPVNELKIPREFVLTLSDNRQLAIIKAIKVMADNLNLHTVVEGIETKEQLDLFRELAFDCVQGYYIAKPLSKEDYIKRL